LNRLLYRRLVSKIIVNCHAIRERMREGAEFLDPGQFVVVPNGIDTSVPPRGDGAGLRKRLGLSADTPVAAVVSRLSEMKGHRHLLAAWPAVLEAVPRATLLIAGDGELADSLREAVRDRGIDESVRFLGFLPDPTDILEATDLFVLPSIRDEGMANALLEAMWHARPAVVSDCGGLPEAVDDGRTGRLVPPGDEAALAREVSGLLADPQLRAKMGHAAQEEVRQRFSLERVSRQLETVFLSLRTEDPH
jgi:glycosyltransferase involved in cell wall biosynthesis